MLNHKFDAIVIGSGIGGLCAAARLTGAGLKVLIVEKSPYLGGRCSHRVREDCIVTTGALMLPMGANCAIRQAFDAVGAEMDMVDLTGRMRYRLSHGDYDLPPGGGGLFGMIEFAMQDQISAKALFNQLLQGLEQSEVMNPISIRHWFDQHTDNSEVKNLFEGYCAALMGTRMHEIAAAEFFRFLKHSSKGSRFGMAKNGNGSLMESLISSMEKKGAVIRRRTRCKRLIINGAAIAGVIIRNDQGEDEIVSTDIVLSNSGPDMTVTLAGGEVLFDKHYLRRLHTNAHDAPIMHASFVMDEPLIEGFNGCMVFGNNRNLIYLEIPSEISPAVSPEGKFLHTAYGAAVDSANPDLLREFNNMLEELEQNFPGMNERATFLVKAKHRGQSPGMHRWAGYGMPVETPIRGLYNVGDGCAPPGTIGTEGAAASAKRAVEMILTNDLI